MAAPLTNPSFETGDLTGWTATSGVVVSSAPHVFSGTYAAHIPDGPTGAFYVEQTTRYPAFPGLTFDATAYYEQGSASDGRNVGNIYVRWYDGSGNIVGYQNGNYVTSSRTGPDWHGSTVHASYLEGATEVAVGFYVNKDRSPAVHIDAFSWTYPDLPSIDLTYPINGGTYEAGVDVPYRVVIGSSTTFIPQSVTYKAENTVTSVITDVGTVTADPWALNSATLPAGTYNVYAEVTFQGGFTANSDIHALTIGTPPPPDTREFKASNAYTYLVAENFNRLASNIPSTALVTGVELVLDYNIKALLRTKDLGLPDPSAARYEAAFTMVPSGTFEMVLLNKSGTDYTQQGSTITQQVDILRADFSVTEDGTSENKRWTVLDGNADSVTVGSDVSLFGIPTIPASEFTTKSIGLRFYPNLAPKPDFADTGDACFRVNLDKARLRVYFDAGSVEYYFASPDKTQVIKGKLAAYCLDSGAFENGDAAGDLQLTPDLEIMDGTQSYIGGDWTIHSAYPPTDLNQIGNVDARTDFTTTGMSYNGLPSYRAVLNNRSRYQFISANFYGDESLDSIYGVHGLPRAFAYNGEFFYKICTQPDPEKDSPRHVAYHHGHLALGYKEGRVDISVVGEPYNFDGAQGASSWAVGDRVVGLSELSGAILGVFGSKSITGISGTTVDNFATQVLSPNVGAIEYTVTDMGFPVYANAYGIYTLAQTAQYGDYLGSPLSQPVSPWLRPRLVRRMTSAKEVEVAWPVRSKNQYRVAFKDGYVLSMTMNNGLQSAPTFSFQNYFWDDGYQYLTALDVTGDLPDGKVTDTGTISYVATGGAGPYHYEVTSGALPPGAVLNESTGVVDYTYSAVGGYAWVITVTDSIGQTATHPDDANIISNIIPKGAIFNSYSNTLTVFNPSTDAVISTMNLSGGVGSNTTTNIREVYVAKQGNLALTVKRNGTFEFALLNSGTTLTTSLGASDCYGIGVTANENFAYCVGKLTSPNSALFKMDVEEGTFDQYPLTGISDPRALALNEADNCVYISAGVTDTWSLARYDLGTNTVTASRTDIGPSASVTGGPLVYRPAANALYCANNALTAIVKMNKTTLATEGTYASGAAITKFLPSHDGAYLYIIRLVSGSTYSVTKWSTATDSAAAAPVNLTRPWSPGMTLSSDGTKLYVTVSDFVTGTGTNDITSVIDTFTMTQLTTINTGANPTGIGINI